MLNRQLIDREFDFLKDVGFFDVSHVAMPPKRVQEAYAGFMQDYVANFGENALERAWEIVEEARGRVASLIGCEAHEIGFVKNTCEGISILAQGYPFEPGDNVIIADQEHSSTLFAWINLHEQKGVELRVVRSRDGELRPEDYFALADEHTKAVIVSAVQFTTGYYMDLAALGAGCRERGILFVVDAIQGLGRLDIRVDEMKIDYLSCAGNKGLLAAMGEGAVYCSDRIIGKIKPPYAGYQSVVNHVAPPAITTNFETLEWRPDARRLESGNLNYAGILSLSEGVALINELGVAEIEKEVLRLEGLLRKRLEGLPLTVVQAKDPRNWSGLVCVYYPPEAEDAVVAILGRRKIYTTMRGGYIRLAIDFYNTEEQVENAAKALWEIAALAN